MPSTAPRVRFARNWMIRQQPGALDAFILTAVQGLKRLFGACIGVREKVRQDGRNEAKGEGGAEEADEWNLCEPDTTRGKVSEVCGKANTLSLDPFIYVRDNVRVPQTNNQIHPAASTNMTRNLPSRKRPQNDDLEVSTDTLVQEFETVYGGVREKRKSHSCATTKDS